MLFAIGAENSSSGNVVPVGILPDGSGWDVRINDEGNNFPFTEQADWSFVYVPYSAPNLIAAGNLSLTSSPTVGVQHSVGSFTASRVDLGPNGTITPPGTPDTIQDTGRVLNTNPGKNDTTGYQMVGISNRTTQTVGDPPQPQ
jgi:hypothetical protein